MKIFHIAEPKDWAMRSGTYQPSSFDTEGFIHCSTFDQLEMVLERHFPGRVDVLILEIDTSSFGETLVYEDLYDLGEDYPHIYSHIPLEAVVNTHERSQIS